MAVTLLTACGSDGEATNIKAKIESTRNPLAKITYSTPTLTPDVLGTTRLHVSYRMTPTFEEIRKKRETLSYTEWVSYTHALRGTRIDGWLGRIYQVFIASDNSYCNLAIWLHSTYSLENTEGQGSDLELWFTRNVCYQWKENDEVRISGTVANVDDTGLGTINLVDPQVIIQNHVESICKRC